MTENRDQVSVVSDQPASPLPIKIFAMNDYDWFSAASVEDALRAMADQHGFPDTPEGIAALQVEYGEMTPAEISEADMDRLKFVDTDEDGERVDGAETVTFREHLAEMIRDGEKFPCFFASTEY
jgi:hypothetical protein